MNNLENQKLNTQENSLQDKPEQISDLENNNESPENSSEISVVDDAEQALRLKAEIKKIEIKAQANIDAINQINKELGVDEVSSDLQNIDTTKFPAFKYLQSKIIDLKGSLNKFSKAAAVAGLMFGATSEGVTQSNSNSNTEKAQTEWKNKQYNLYKKGLLAEGSLIKDPTTGKLYKIRSLNKEDLKKDNSFEGGEQKTSLNISQFFKTGTTEFINSQAEIDAKDALRDFLQSADLKNFKINVLGTYSSDRVYAKNQELAESRKDLGNKILLEVLKEKYSQQEINKIIIEAQAKGKSLLDSYTQEKIDEMTSFEKNQAIDKNQGISFKLESIKKNIETEDLFFPNNFNSLEDFKNVSAVIVDRSYSMRDDVLKVEDFLKKINLENKKLNKEVIDIFSVEGGDKEAHLNTLISVLNKLEKNTDQKEIVLITDEPDNKSAGIEYINKINQILKEAKEKNIKIIFKILSPVGGAAKIIQLDENTKNVLDSKGSSENMWFASIQEQN